MQVGHVARKSGPVHALDISSMEKLGNVQGDAKPSLKRLWQRLAWRWGMLWQRKGEGRMGGELRRSLSAADSCCPACTHSPSTM